MKDTVTRYICVHGHFYQPPRENPWLGEIELQESAHPWHDWNQRITEECYTPNAHARILDADQHIIEVIDNYRYISFNFGPTLLSWLQKKAPQTYEAIVQADRLSAEDRSGHGNAIAQAYHHTILPLSSRRDKITQVIWGIEDFRRRFGRDPEGMWAPETAIDIETLDIMAQHGILFTILAPGQAARFRGDVDEPWGYSDVWRIDPTRPYICHLKKGRTIALFFYDGPISQAIAFERLLDNGQKLKDRLVGAFSDIRAWPQLVNIATDGESYGHHHPFGEMALSYAISQLRREPDVRITNYGEFLAKHPPTAEVEIVERSSWSCSHGVGRWSEDCGCRLTNRPGWNQQWRASLRRAMNILRDRVDAIFELEASKLLKQPWKARNEYVKAKLDPENEREKFLRSHAKEDLNPGERTTVLELLEAQRNRMMIYTSCGWFFDDVQGIETLQIMKYAARVLQLTQERDPTLREDFLAELATCSSNHRPHLRGDEVFERMVSQGVTDLAKVAAQVTISSMFAGSSTSSGLNYKALAKDWGAYPSGVRDFRIGRMFVSDLVTDESRSFIVAILYLGGIDLRCSVKVFEDEKSYQEAKDRLSRCFSEGSSTEMIRRLDEVFPGRYYSFRDLFLEARSKILELVTRNMYREQAETLTDFYYKTKDLALLIHADGARIPEIFVTSARFVLNRLFNEQLERLARGDFPDDLRIVLDEAVVWDIKLDTGAAEKMIQRRVLELIDGLGNGTTDEEAAAPILRFLDLCGDLEIPVQLSEAQIRIFGVVNRLASEGKEVPSALRELAHRLKVRVSQ